jgi:hypothetical protein
LVSVADGGDEVGHGDEEGLEDSAAETMVLLLGEEKELLGSRAGCLQCFSTLSDV